MRRRLGEINHNDGGRGVYFPDPISTAVRDANAVPDRSVQSMRVQFSGSVQRSSLNKFHVCAQAFLFEM
jgi:hypothetical protein